MESAEAMTKLFSLEKSLSEPVRRRTPVCKGMGGTRLAGVAGGVCIGDPSPPLI